MLEKIEKSDQEWRKKLTPQQYRITREKGTEPPFTGLYWDSKSPGTYRCIACRLPLFESDRKFDSGTGWPSFWDVIDAGHVETFPDERLGTVRTELRCARCGAHLGHVFTDGPRPTGLRYCINSAALDFVEERSETATQESAPG